MKKLLNIVIDNYTIIFLCLTLLSFIYRISLTSTKPTEAFLLSFFTWSVGARGIFAFIGNWFSPFANEIAKAYEWPEDSSWQREIASADGAFGVLGILCNWFYGDFWTATAIGVSFCWFFSESKALCKVSRMKRDPAYQMNQRLHFGMYLDLVSSIVLFSCMVAWKFGF